MKSELENKMEMLTPDTIMDLDLDWDRYDPLYYSSDQMFVTYPVRFPTIDVQICSNSILSAIADEVMHEEGYGGMWDEGCDDVWYDFYLEFCQLHENSKIECANRIDFQVANHPEAPDMLYMIELTEEQQNAFVEWFKKQLEDNGADAYERFNEAREEMNEMVEYERSLQI